MSEILKSAVEERQKLWHEAKAVIDGAEAEGRSLSGEEESKYQTLSAELDKRAAFIEEYKKTADREARAAEAAEGFLAPATQAAAKSDADHIRALARGEVRSFEFGNEQRAMSPSTTGAPIPTSFYNQIIGIAKFAGPMLTTSTMLRTSGGENLQIPSQATYSAGSITAAGSAIAASDPTFNAFTTLGAWKYGGLITIARELIEDSGVDLLGFLADQIGVGLGSSVNAGLTTGTGTTQPSGIVTGAGSAVTGSTAVSGAFTADNLIDLVYSLNTVARKRPGAGFQMNSSGIANARKLKDTAGNYVFSPALSADKNDLLLGYSIFENPDVASPAVGAKSVIFGDLASYYVREAGGIRLDRSDDYAFANDQVTFRYTWRGDGALVQSSHVKYFKGGAS